MTDENNKNNEDEAVNEASETPDSKPKTFGKGTKKDVSENEGTDFDKEVENLDDFLLESEEEEDLILDDHDEMVAASNYNEEKKKSGAGKYIGYFVFIVLLGGLLYGGVVYGPQLFNNPDLEAFQQNMANRTNGYDATAIMAEDNSGDEGMPETATEDEQIPNSPPSEQIAAEEPLPSAADEVLIVEEDTLSEDEDLIEVSEDPAAVQETNAPATTIADALALTQATETEDMPSAQVEEVTVEEINLSETADSNTNSEVDTEIENDAFERTPAVSLTEARQQNSESEENLPPLEEEQIAIANDVMEMPEEDIIEVVEAVDQVSEETKDVANNANITPEAEEALVEKAVKETVEVSAESEEPVESEKVAENVINQTEEAVAKASEDNSVVDEDEIAMIDVDPTPDASVNEAVEEKNKQSVEEVTAVESEAVVPPVPAPSEPKATVSTPKPTPQVTKREDARVVEAQAAYKNGNYSKALSLYNAVLSDDPSNTSALTGRQLATAKMRTAPADAATFETAMASGAMPNASAYEPSPAYNTADNTFENVVVSVNGQESQALRQRVQKAETTAMQDHSYTSSDYGMGRLNSRILNRGQSTMRTNDKEAVLLPQVEAEAVPADVVAQPATQPIRAMETAEPNAIDDSVTFEETMQSQQSGSPQQAKATMMSSSGMDVMAVESKPVLVAPMEPETENFDAPMVDEAPAATPKNSELDTMIMEADSNPRNAALAVAIADRFNAQGNDAMAREWYKKALQRDSMYSAGLNRMAIYDSLAGVR